MGSVPASPHAAPVHTTGSSSSGDSTGVKEARARPAYAPGTQRAPRHSPRCAGRSCSRAKRLQNAHCATSNHFKIGPAARALRHHPDARRATPPGRAKQTHAPCVSSIPIPPSSRLSCRPIPRTSAHHTSPSCFDKRNRERRANAPSKHPSHPRPPLLLPHVVLGPPSLALSPLPLLLAISSHPCPSIPVVCSISSSIRNPDPDLDPRHHNPVVGIRTRVES
ncbi:hypothetical protein B0H13DRAFT_2352596 [Mycena leptocephala]|nr:hypothetical protein B0H13DRAFT_2352596 [Mycena leptocephala]